MIERIEGRYVATDATGRDLGSYVELVEAQQRLEGFTGETATNMRDVLMMKAIIVMTGVSAVGLALSVVLRWQ
jgi:hypothetical protein